MRKNKYLIGFACIALSVGVSLSGCSSKKEDIAETESSTEADPNHIPYKEIEPDTDAPDVKQTEHWTEAVDIDKLIEDEAKSEDVDTQSDDESDKVDMEPEVVMDDTGEEIEKVTKLDGGSSIEIKSEDEFKRYNNMTGEDEVGKILRLDDYDSIEVYPIALQDGVTYNVENGRIKFAFPDGKTVEVVKAGNGFMDASKLNMSTVKDLMAKYFNFDASGGNATKYEITNVGPQIVGEASSADLTSSAIVIRGNNGVYVVKYTGISAYDYIEMENNILFATAN